MTTTRRIAQISFLLSLVSFMSACVIAEPREGYWDRDHARYYHEHAWHACEHDSAYCR
jgi:hypothetical protein